jgi:hypothetical protein
VDTDTNVLHAKSHYSNGEAKTLNSVVIASAKSLAKQT